MGRDLKREREIARKTSKMKTFQAEKTTYARAKRHEGAGVLVGPVVVAVSRPQSMVRRGWGGGQGSRDPFICHDGVWDLSCRKFKVI